MTMVPASDCTDSSTLRAYVWRTPLRGSIWASDGGRWEIVEYLPGRNLFGCFFCRTFGPPNKFRCCRRRLQQSRLYGESLPVFWSGFCDQRINRLWPSFRLQALLQGRLVIRDLIGFAGANKFF